MADVTMQMDFQGKAAVQGMQQVGKETDKLKRKVDALTRGQQSRGYSQSGGMAALEASRLVEDFAVAGMRGALNNIPGIVMSLSGSTGLTAAISLAAVGLTVFGKELLKIGSEAQTTSDDLAKFTAASESLGASLKKMRDDASAKGVAEEVKSIKDAAKDFMDIAVGFDKDPTKAFDIESDRIERARSAADAIEGLRTQLEVLRKQEKTIDFDLGAKRGEEDVKRLSDLVSELEQRGPRLAEMLAQTPTGDSSGIGKLSEDIAKVERNIASSTAAIEGYKAEIADLEKQSGTMGTKAKQYFTDLADSAIRALGKGETLDAVKARAGMGGLGPEARLGAQIDIAKGELRAQENIKKQLQEKLAIQQAAQDAGKTVKEQTEKELKANQDALDAARQKLSIANEELAAKRTQADLMRQIAAEEEKQKLKKLDEDISKMRISGADMLSSVGRIGGSGAEFANAIATVNYQRDSLKELRAIARNTRRNTVATYN